MGRLLKRGGFSLATAMAVVALMASPAPAQNSMFPKGAPSGMNMSQLMSQLNSMGLGGMSGGMGGMSGGSMSGGLGGMSGGLGSISGGSMGGGGMGGMSGGLGGGGVSGNNFGGTRAGSNFGQNSGMGMGAQGQGNFVGRNANQFVGMNAMTGSNMQGGMNGGRQNFLGGNRGGLNLDGQQNFNQNGGMQQQVPLRAQQRIAFEYPRLAHPAMQTQVETRFNKLTTRHPHIQGVKFEADDAGLVVLRGEVKSESAAKLAEKLVRLEPGVKSVRSELTFPAK